MVGKWFVQNAMSPFVVFVDNHGRLAVETDATREGLVLRMREKWDEMRISILLLSLPIVGHVQDVQYEPIELQDAIT
jgi:hypothetical protein